LENKLEKKADKLYHNKGIIILVLVDINLTLSRAIQNLLIDINITRSYKC